MNSVAETAKSKAENFSSQGMKLFTNVTMSVRHHIKGTHAVESGTVENGTVKDCQENDKKLTKIKEEEHVDEPAGTSGDLGSGLWDKIQKDDSNESILNLGFEDDDQEIKKEDETNIDRPEDSQSGEANESPRKLGHNERRDSSQSKSKLIVEERDTTNLPIIE